MASSRNKLEYLWPIIGLLAVGLSGWLLYGELRAVSAGEVLDGLRHISTHQYVLAIASTLVAYAALAGYDRIALLHLGVKSVSWRYVSLASFTAYALSHNIGASVLSGAVVRYRAYSQKGLSAMQVAVLVTVCSATFALGAIILGGAVLTFTPEILARLDGMLPSALTRPESARILGIVMLALVGVYVVGSIRRLPPLTIRKFRIEYPRPTVAAWQLVVAPMELLGAAGIIYFALPDAGNPGFIVVLGVFLASFSAALVSHAPGGLGVFELIFIKAMPDIAPAEVLAALLVFRLFYLILPLAMSIVVVLLFERGRLLARAASSPTMSPQPPEPPPTADALKVD